MEPTNDHKTRRARRAAWLLIFALGVAPALMMAAMPRSIESVSAWDVNQGFGVPSAPFTPRPLYTVHRGGPI